jgi:hypothetical protein
VPIRYRLRPIGLFEYFLREAALNAAGALIARGSLPRID